MGTDSRHRPVLSQLDKDFKSALQSYTIIQSRKPDTGNFTQEAGEWAADMRQALVCVFLLIYLLE